MDEMIKHKIFLCLASAFLCCNLCCEDSIFHNVENPYIRIVNQSNDTLWIEILLPRDFPQFKGDIEDSIFYGLTYWEVQPNSMKQIHINGRAEKVNYEPFAARIFIMDSCSTININHARFKYYIEECGLDSLQVIQILKNFEHQHMLSKRWCTKAELDSINWTIVYPQIIKEK